MTMLLHLLTSVLWIGVADGFVASSFPIKSTFWSPKWGLHRQRLILHETAMMIPVCEYHQITIPSSSLSSSSSSSLNYSTTTVGELLPLQEILVHDLTRNIQTLLDQSNMTAGTITVISRHTTTAIVINEYESRLVRDIAETYLNLIPPDERSVAAATQRRRDRTATTTTNDGVRYQHNDIDQRPESVDEAERCVANGWNILTDPQQLQAWRDQEPINAHSHLLAMLLGSSESIPVAQSAMVLGQWQSILLIDLDGPRDRTVGVQLTGFR
jgi:thiamine phosphate synthase YjbQ (UPF0047 family)